MADETKMSSPPAYITSSMPQEMVRQEISITPDSDCSSLVNNPVS